MSKQVTLRETWRTKGIEVKTAHILQSYSRTKVLEVISMHAQIAKTYWLAQCRLFSMRCLCWIATRWYIPRFTWCNALPYSSSSCAITRSRCICKGATYYELHNMRGRFVSECCVVRLIQTQVFQRDLPSKCSQPRDGEIPSRNGAFPNHGRKKDSCCCQKWLKEPHRSNKTCVLNCLTSRNGILDAACFSSNNRRRVRMGDFRVHTSERLEFKKQTLVNE